MNSGSEVVSMRQDLTILSVLTLPFLLNDFSNIFVTDYRLWLAIDYISVKALPLVFIALLLGARKISWADLGVKPIRVGSFTIWTIVVTSLGTVLDQYGSRFFVALLPDTRLGGMPPITNRLVYQVDLHF